MAQFRISVWQGWFAIRRAFMTQVVAKYGVWHGAIVAVWERLSARGLGGWIRSTRRAYYRKAGRRGRRRRPGRGCRCDQGAGQRYADGIFGRQHYRSGIPGADRRNIRTGMGSLPFCQATLRGMRCPWGPYATEKKGYPATPKTLGEEIRKRRES